MAQANPDNSTPMPAVSTRRRFLGRAATFLAAGAAGTTTAIVVARPAAVAPIVQENPAIISLGERIEPLLAVYRNAAEDRLKARASAEANCPAVPKELVCKGPFWAGCTTSECDVEGKEILQDVFTKDRTKYARRPREILHSESMQAAIARGNLHCDRRTRFGKKVVRLIETAENTKPSGPPRSNDQA